MAKQFTDNNFDQDVLEMSKTKPVLVDFFASWCGPCKMQAPIIEELATAMGDKASVGKLDTEDAPNTAQKYGVMSIPTLLLFKDAKVVETMVGLQPKESLEDVIKKYI